MKKRELYVLGIKALPIWALMVFVPLWIRSMPQIQDIYQDRSYALLLDGLLFAWLFGVHAVALMVYRRERAEWMRASSNASVTKHPRH